MKTERLYLSILIMLLMISSFQASAQCPATIDANFADALRTLYPSQNFVDANNTLTSNVTSYTGTLDFKGWGNTTTSSGANSSYASKPKLTTIEGIQCFTSLTKLNVNNQNLTGALPAVAQTLTELRCQTNNLTSLPTLPPNLTYIDCRINQISALPDLPSTLKYLICGANKLSSIPTLPAGLLYLKCNIQHTKAPSFTISSENDKLLETLPELPSGLLALNCTDNKLTSLPTLPSSLVYLNATNNKTLACFTTLTNTNFFSAALPNNAYFTDGGALAEPRLNLTNTAVSCLANLPTGWTTSKITPTSFASAAALCNTAPAITSYTATCALPGATTAYLSLTAIGGGTLEYSTDGTTYQSSGFLTNLGAGAQAVFIRRKSDPACPSPILSTTIAIAQCNPQTYYANYATGADQPGNGSSASTPFKTISYALSQITPDQGSTLQLSAGTFEETSILNVPSGINIVGVGSGQNKNADSTVVKVNSYYNMLDNPQLTTCGSATNVYQYSYDPSWEKFVIQVNGTLQRLSGFKLDGQAKQCHGGIFMKNGTGVIYDDLKVVDFRYAGFWLAKSLNSEIKNSYVKNNAFGNDKGAIGNINFWNGINLLIHDNYIEETEPAYNTRPNGPALGSYGIKIHEALSRTFCPTGDYWNRQIATPSTVKIYNNTIKVLASGTWGGGLAPAISIELLGNTLTDCEIYNNYVNNHISIPTNYGSTPAGRGVSVRLHDNFIDLGNKYSYALEANCPGLEFDHNFVNGGYYPIAQYQDARNNWHDQDIHHNVFYGFQGNASGNKQNFTNYSLFPTDWHFNNNTVVATKAGLNKLFALNRSESNPLKVPIKGAQIKNNIFLNLTSSKMDAVYSTKDKYGSTIFDNPDISNNLFYNVQAFGKDSVVIDSARLATSILQLTGDKPKPYFELAQGSPAVDAGVEIPGITDGYQGTKPDIGAYESNQTVNLSVAQQDGDGGQTTNNQLKPNLQLSNAGNTPVSYQDLTARYWLTAEDFAPVNTFIDYAQVGNSNVKLKYVPLAQPHQGALGYLEYSFDPATGKLNAGSNSGIIQSRVAKTDWTPFNETDDYSFGANTSLTPNNKITLYRNGVLAWGTEPATVPINQAITVQMENRNNSPATNTISTYLKISNVGNVPLTYGDLKVRYWFSAEGTQPLNSWIDFAQLGTKVKGSFVKPATALTGNDTYFELAVDSTAGTLYPLSSSGNIQYRLAKNDWSAFNEANDYSYKPAAPMADNDHITVYYKGQLVYGTEPASGARLAAEFPTSELSNVVLYPNPSTGGRLFIRSGGATISRVELTTIAGQPLSAEIAASPGDEVQVTPSKALTPGIYLLTIHTTTGRVTKRLLVSETGFHSNR